MPAPGLLLLGDRCQQALGEIITLSQRIRYSALRCAGDQEDSQYLDNIEKLRQQLDTIRGSADTILEIITLQNRIVDERIITWLFNGGLPPCLDKLKEMDDIFKLDGPLRPALPPTLPLNTTASNIAKAIASLEKHKDIFYFFLTPEVWDRERHPQQSSQLPQPDTHLNAEEAPQGVQEITVRSSTETDHGHGENSSRLKVDQEATRRKAFLNQKLDEVSRWLTALDCTDKHNETLKQRQQGTCMWFPGIGAFKAWRSGSSPFLWVHGRGGCGKSVLVASTIEHLRNTLEDGDVLAYYYCDFRNERSISPMELMRSLLSQLFRHFRDCGVDAGALPNRILEEKSDGSLTLNDLDQMTHLVLRAAGRFSRPPMILIDALDECAEAKKLLPALAMLVHPDIRLLVTSRPLKVFKDHFGNYTSLSLHAMCKELAADIGLHITQELYSHAQLRSADLKLKRQIREKLHEKADGRFRWVQCQLDTLKRCSSRQELRDALDNLPGELKTTYEQILSKIDERTPEARLVRRALVWLIAALIPLRLTQLLDGLSFDPRERKIQHGTQSLGPALLDALSSLVSYDKGTDILSLSHFTVKEYLTSRAALPMYHIIPHEAHIEVAEMCMFYITSLLKQVRFRAGLAISESSPMLSYVFSTGLNHLAYVDPASSVALDVIESFASEVNHHPSHWDLLCEMREEDPQRFYPPWPSSRHDVALYVLIAYIPVGLLESLLSRSNPLKLRPGTNPLVYAADLWKTTHAITLLRNNIDATAPGLVVDDSRHALPLEVAIDLGNDILVGELLQKGSVVTSELLSTAVCMPWCSTRVLVKLVQTDAFAEWAHEIGDEDLYRAIFNSARPNAGDSRQADRDHVAIARRLRDLGQNLAPDSSFGAELVERALHAAHISMLEFLLPPDQPPPARFLITACTGSTSETVSVVHFLLEKRVNVRAVTRGCRDTALHLAAMSSWEPRALELIKMLLDAGCNPSTRNKWRETPVTIAVKRGHHTVLEHLLSRKAILPSCILLLALKNRRKPRMIELLLRAGANINARTASGNTGIHLAIMDIKEIRYEKLQDKEPAVGQVAHERWQHREHTVSQPEYDNSEHEEYEAVDNNENNEAEGDIYGPCEEYEEAERLEVVKILIETGCDPTSRGAGGRTVLDVAIGRSYTSMVDHLLSHGVPLPPDVLLTALQHRLIRSSAVVTLLVCKGAEVHSTTTNGDTVLHLAVIHYEESLCLDLIKTFVEAGCDPTSYDAQRRTVLDVAIERKYTYVMDYLLSHGVPLPPDILLTVLQYRFIRSSEVVMLLVYKGADVHSTTTNGDTVLHLAITHCRESLCLNLIKIFIDAGCDPTSYGARHRTVLDVAIERGYTRVVDYLLSHGVLLPPDILSTALQRRYSLEVVMLLVHKGADVHSTTTNGDTVLHLAITHCRESLCLNLIKIFIDAGCDPTSYGARHRTVLNVAIERGYTRVVDYLLSHGVLLPPDILSTALQRRYSPEVVMLLVHKGADVHSTTTNGDTVLHLATIHYKESLCLDLIKIFIDAGCNPTSYGAQRRAVLDVAIERKYTYVVDYLLSYGVPLPPDILLTALQYRFIRSSQAVTFLIGKGADVHSTTTNGDTVLHLAIIHYKESLCLDLIKIFIDAGCDPTSYGAQRRTVLDVAIERKYTYVVDYLLSYGVPLPPDILLTALQYRFIRNSQAVTFLIGKGADVHSTTTNGDTVLHLAIIHYKESLCLDLIKIFTDAGCDPTSYGAQRGTVLDVAIERSYTHVVDYLLSHGVPLPLDILSTALQHRSMHSSEVAMLLVHKGADVHSTTTNGDTLLHLAVIQYKESFCINLIKIFVDAGCNPVSYDAQGRTVLDVAIEQRYTYVINYLLSHGVPLPSDILLTALQHRFIHSSEAVRLLVHKGADVHSTTTNGDTVLHLAVIHYEESLCLDLIETFVEAGCDPTSYGARRRTVLDLAIERNYTYVVDYLLSHGVLLSSDILLTALRYQFICSLEVVTFLLGKGADVHSTTTNGDTVLHLAMIHCQESSSLDLIKIFVDAGCNPNSVNSQGRTVLEVAIREDYTSVVEYLLSYGASLPPNILPTDDAGAHSTIFDGDSLLQTVQASYSHSDGSQRIVEILRNKQGRKRNNNDLGGVACVAKRPRLE